MNQQAGASCPSRTPSISLAPPRALPSLLPSSYPPSPSSSTFFASSLPSLRRPLSFFPPFIRRAQTRRSSLLPRITQRGLEKRGRRKGGRFYFSLSPAFFLLHSLSIEDVSMASLYRTVSHRSFYARSALSERQLEKREIRGANVHF